MARYPHVVTPAPVDYTALVVAAVRRVKRMIQFVSQVAPPSAEKACSERAVVALIPNQRNRTRTGIPSY